MAAGIVLASASPRRRALLSELFAEFDVFVSDFDEESIQDADPIERARKLALAKAKAVQARVDSESLVIGADTIVVVGEREQLNKPDSPNHAEQMLASLSGRLHRVVTGVALLRAGLERSFTEQTSVEFRVVGPDEISAYVATGEPMDKAGAYAIQGGAAGFVTAIRGSLSNVIGLPLERLREELAEFQVLGSKP